MVPHILKDPGYLVENEYQVVESRERAIAAAVTPALIEQLRSGTLSIRQIPGERNALGHIKFMFPNEYSVYLHGTPAKALFAKSRRDFSHGCIRVEKPIANGEVHFFEDTYGHDKSLEELLDPRYP